MLLLRRSRTFRDVVDAGLAVVLLPASSGGASDADNVRRANDIAVAARVSGLGVTVLERQGKVERELFTAVSGGASQCVAFARTMLRDRKTGESWFLHLSDSALVQEFENGERAQCELRPDGFTLSYGHKVVLADWGYVPAQYNTAWMHSRGCDVGPHLRPTAAVPERR